MAMYMENYMGLLYISDMEPAQASFEWDPA